MSTGHSMHFQMVEHPWSGGVIIFDDGQTKLHKHRLRPDTPVLVQVEGLQPSAEQILMCRNLWQELYSAIDFRVASFCPAILPHARTIMAPDIMEIPA
ncbi:hypothetical protein [Rhodopseudomonas sp. RCAM05734]|uniref:hypothetical protein n=1 Tax=Rhodopseudomonas sp. RCAM05734 TaxID=3457549 RepID=UPI004044DF0E